MSDERSATNWAMLIYALHAVSLLTGILTAASIVGAFLTGWPSIIAVILNYIKRSDAEGTWVESHFTWQIRTFWWSLVWCIVGVATAILIVGLIILLASAVWFVYRIVRGWTELNEGRPMYA